MCYRPLINLFKVDALFIELDIKLALLRKSTTLK